MPELILTIDNHHTPDCGKPPTIRDEPASLYLGYFANRYGEQWIFVFNYQTREASLQGGDAGWERVYEVRNGRVEDLILNQEELAWLQACWKAATFGLAETVDPPSGERKP